MPLNGQLDTRSRPADLAPGTIRYKLNLAINSSGKLCRRPGHEALNFGPRSDTPDAVANWDLHRRGTGREPITLLTEITSTDSLRYLFAGSSTRVSWLHNDTSEWTDIVMTGMAATLTPGGRWKAAGLRDKVILTNNIDPPLQHELGELTEAIVAPGIEAAGITRAKVVVQYQNVIVLMNLHGPDDPETPLVDLVPLPNRIQWSNFRDATSFDFDADGAVTGWQDLDDGEIILNAAELAGVLYIFTDRAIWRMFPSGDTSADASVFGFHRWYSSPKERTACLAYDNALVATGKEFFWFGRNTIFWMNQFSQAPSSPDWLLKASGLVFEGNARVSPSFCESPVGGFVPDASGAAKEAWFSYPRLGSEDGVNDYSIVLNFNTDSVTNPYVTADYADVGYTAFCIFSRTTEAGVQCDTTPTFIGASGEDYCLKAIGEGFSRVFVNLINDDVTLDIPDADYETTAEGYFSQIMFLCPFGYDHREKILRNVVLSHDTRDAISETPNQVNLRIGNSYHLADPLDTATRGGVQWHQIDALPLQVPDEATQAEMVTEGTRDDSATEWPNQQEVGRFLYVDLKIQSFTGAAPIGSDSAWNNLLLDWLLLP